MPVNFLSLNSHHSWVIMGVIIVVLVLSAFLYDTYLKKSN